MSVFHIARNNNKESLIDIQSKVVDFQVISKKPLYPLIEPKNTGIDNNSPELFPQNIIEQPKKKCSRKEINGFYSRIKYIRKKYNIKK